MSGTHCNSRPRWGHFHEWILPFSLLPNPKLIIFSKQNLINLQVHMCTNKIHTLSHKNNASDFKILPYGSDICHRGQENPHTSICRLPPPLSGNLLSRFEAGPKAPLFLEIQLPRSKLWQSYQGTSAFQGFVFSGFQPLMLIYREHTIF